MSVRLLAGPVDHVQDGDGAAVAAPQSRCEQGQSLAGPAPGAPCLVVLVHGPQSGGAGRRAGTPQPHRV